MDKNRLESLAKLIRYYILISTTKAGSGHPTSSLSAVELMTALYFGGWLRHDLDNPDNPANDRVIFSKGHAAPLFYALWAAAGKVSEEELLTLRQFGSPLEGHPTMFFPYTEGATGSLGQGLSFGLGLALNGKYLDQIPYRTFVLLGDSEMAEGSIWEGLNLAGFYELNNLIGILDVNRLGQRGETMFGHDLSEYERRIESFGWRTVTVDGRDLSEIDAAFEQALSESVKPTMIIARTLKGQGISFLEDQPDWHGKPLPEDKMKEVVAELGEIDKSFRGEISSPKPAQPADISVTAVETPRYKPGDLEATRKAYGYALVDLIADQPEVVALDAEVSNSTHAEQVKKHFPGHFFEMYVAEQNMVSAAQGLARRGKVPFVSSFAAFLTRAYDQIRMAQYSKSNIKVVGSHAGVSIGADGSSQMGLEDIAMMRAVNDSVVLYPSDAVSCQKLTRLAAEHDGLVYIRTTRAKTPVIYDYDEEFKIGGAKVIRQSDDDAVTVVTAGITLVEAIKAYKELQEQGVNLRVIDLYSVKPPDTELLQTAARETKGLITVEDHYPAGGIGEAVCTALADTDCVVKNLAVRKMPRSGEPAELLAYEEIDAAAIIKAVEEIISR